jgi:hypothetical protein
MFDNEIGLQEKQLITAGRFEAMAAGGRSRRFGR